MRIEIISKNYRLDEELKNLITKKLSKFDKYFDKEATAKVKLTIAGNSNVMEITIDAGGCTVRSSCSGDKMNENIDVLLPKLERQIVKYHDKFGTRIKKGALDGKTLYETVAEEDKKGNVVKVKKFNVSVTTVDNAVEEMELLNHNFYIFVNGENNKVSVLYRRNDGDYGLIEPEY
ncbi:MAG: ribosome hibernation-promoting factor, HPF/YfiA family [Christensenellales bacterium]